MIRIEYIIFMRQIMSHKLLRHSLPQLIFILWLYFRRVMSSNNELLLRQWTMLRMIPRYPRKITAREMLEHLQRENFGVTKRTIERDLQAMSSVFPLVADERDKPYGWSWQKNAPAFDLPGLGNNEALTMMMVEQHLVSLLPTTTLDVLAPYFKAARQHLSLTPKAQHVRSWLNKVRTVSANQPLIAPKIRAEVQQSVTEALLSEQQLQISYQARNESKPTNSRIHPLALIQRAGVVYLYVRFFDYEDTRILAMHRIVSATLLDNPVNYPAGFNIDDEINKGRFGFGDGEMIQLKARFSLEYGEHLFETPLSKDQNIETIDDAYLMARATVADTPQLRWWILGLGHGVEVIEPVGLRTEIAKTIQSMSKNYLST